MTFEWLVLLAKVKNLMIVLPSYQIALIWEFFLVDQIQALYPLQYNKLKIIVVNRS